MIKTADEKNIVKKIQNGELDCNDIQLFFPRVIKGLLVDLNEHLKIRGYNVPHMIVNTGDDVMYLINKGYDHSKEPMENTNESWIYQVNPRGVLTIGGIDIQTDQLSNPYTRGNIQIEDDGKLFTLNGEYKRVPLKMHATIKYVTDSFTDMLELTQQIVSNQAFIQTYYIDYLGQSVPCSYKIPDSLEDRHSVEFDEGGQDGKSWTMEISLDIDTNFIVLNHHTIISPSPVIDTVTNIHTSQYETIQSHSQAGSHYRSLPGR